MGFGYLSSWVWWAGVHGHRRIGSKSNLRMRALLFLCSFAWRMCALRGAQSGLRRAPTRQPAGMPRAPVMELGALCA